MPTALVTGSNRGIGAGVCQQLAREGYEVWACARDPAAAESAAAALSESGRAACCDVSDAVSRVALSEQLRAEGVRLDALVHNAGVSLNGFGPEVVARTLAVNFYGPLELTDLLLPLLSDHARIVMVSSGMGALSGAGEPLASKLKDPRLDRTALLALSREFERAVAHGNHTQLGWPNNAYSASKMLLNGLVRVLDRELQDRPLLVNAVCPGWVQTDMGGASAPRTVEQGAASVVWAATLPATGVRGGFYRDGQPIPW